MRIQNNITAMNTHRQYTINNDNVAKAAEKLSSGYRINRAGDDAAGLAISEKMRSQIRGLNMATKNSQDAISLVQTAEGALQETHSMLQRMNELAVQAATGTNETIDRDALAKEFEQLKKEINDVAEQTTFNNMKILDGSLGYEEPARSAATAGLTTTTATIEGTADSPVGGAIAADEVAGVNKATGQSAKVTIDLSGITVASTKTGSLDLSVTFADGSTGTLSITAGGAVTGAQTGAAGFPGTLIYQLKDSTGTAITPSAAISGSFGSGADADKLTITIPGVDDDPSGTVTAVTGLAGGTTDTTGATAAAATLDQAGETKVSNAVAAVKGYEFDASKLNYGDKITVGGETLTVAKQAGDVTSGKALVIADLSAATATDIAAAMNTALGANAKVQVAASTNAPAGKEGLTITQKGTDANGNFVGDVSMKWKDGGASNVKTTIEFDAVKMKEGDKVEVKIGDTTYKYTVEKGDKAADVIKGLVDDAGNKLSDTTDEKILVQSNAVIVTGKPVEVSLADWDKAGMEHNAMRIQVGALEDEQLNIAIDAMNTAGLKLDEHNLDDQDSAGSAITAVRAAINQVSTQRATLGAMQNRLDHKIANLKVSSENLSAAESRIRDVDMASEMTNFTKNNILSQAATAMLAQANALPQNVLSLLG